MPPPTQSPMQQPANGNMREVIALAYPVVLTQLSMTCMMIVDSAMVGRLGATQLAAVGFGGIWMWTILSLLLGTATGVQTFVSQMDGAGNARECGGWCWQGIWSVVPATALLVVGIWPYLPDLVAFIGPSTELQGEATDYITHRLPGEVGLAFHMVLTSFYRGIGETRTPLYTSLFANVLNAILDYGLIFGELGLPEWGLSGAGVATAVGNWASAVLLFVAFRRRSLDIRYDTHLVGPDLRAIARFLRTGLPVGGQWIIGTTSWATVVTMVAHMGDKSMAASQAFLMLMSLSFMQAVGISVAASTLTGRYVGAQQLDAVRRSFDSSVKVGLVLGGAIALLFITLPEMLLRIFTDDPAVVALGRPLLLVGAGFQFCDSVAIICSGALRGAGDTRYPFLIETATGWGLFVPLAYVLGVRLDLGLTAAWFAGLCYVFLMAIALIYRFRSGAWQRIRI